jgi:hypothetical protein
MVISCGGALSLKVKMAAIYFVVSLKNHRILALEILL